MVVQGLKKYILKRTLVGQIYWEPQNPFQELKINTLFSKSEKCKHIFLNKFLN